MRLQYIFHCKENTKYPFHVKSDWEPPVQQSVALSPSQTPAVFRSPSLARFFDRVLPQATNRGGINESIERHHPTTLSSAEAPTGIQKKNISGGGRTMRRARFLSPLPNLLAAQRSFCGGDSLRLEYLTKKSVFWIHASIRARDLRGKIFLMCALILNRPRNSNIRISTPPVVWKGLPKTTQNKLFSKNIRREYTQLQVSAK